MTLRHGRDGLFAGRVDHADEPEERQVVVDVVEAQLDVSLVCRPHRDSQHPVTLRRKILHRPVPVVGVKPYRLPRGLLGGTHREQAFGCSLDEDHCQAAVVVVQSGHEAVLRLEGDDISPGQVLGLHLGVGPCGRRLATPLPSGRPRPSRPRLAHEGGPRYRVRPPSPSQ